MQCETFEVSEVVVTLTRQSFIGLESLRGGGLHGQRLHLLFERNHFAKLALDRFTRHSDLLLTARAAEEGKSDSQSVPLVLEKVLDAVGVENMATAELDTGLLTELACVADGTELISCRQQGRAFTHGVLTVLLEAGEAFFLARNTIAAMSALMDLGAHFYYQTVVFASIDHLHQCSGCFFLLLFFLKEGWRDGCYRGRYFRRVDGNDIARSLEQRDFCKLLLRRLHHQPNVDFEVNFGFALGSKRDDTLVSTLLLTAAEHTVYSLIVSQLALEDKLLKWEEAWKGQARGQLEFWSLLSQRDFDVFFDGKLHLNWYLLF